MVPTCLLLYCDSSSRGSERLSPPLLQQQSCGSRPKGLRCRPEVGEQRRRQAAQLSPLCAGSRMEGSGPCRGAKEEKGKDGWGAKRKRKETLQVSAFHNISKIPRKLGGWGVHTEKFKLSNGCGSLLKFMEKILLSHPLFSEARPFGTSTATWKGTHPTATTPCTIFSHSSWPRDPLGVLNLSPRFGSELPDSPSKMSIGVSFVSHIAHNQKPISSSEDVERCQEPGSKIHLAHKS